MESGRLRMENAGLTMDMVIFDTFFQQQEWWFFGMKIWFNRQTDLTITYIKAVVFKAYSAVTTSSIIRLNHHWIKRYQLHIFYHLDMGI